MSKNSLSICTCDSNKVKLVMKFIDREWRKGHILAKDFELMKWQYGNNNNLYNWVLGLNGNIINGVLGFIPISKFDSSIINHEFIWLALWKVKETSNTRGLGLRLLKKVILEMPASGFGVLGINPDHLNLYKSLGFKVGQLLQYFLTNSKAKQTLIKNPYEEILPKAKYGSALLKLLNKKNLRGVLIKNIKGCVPFKSIEYFEKRFFSHPIYNYQVYVIQQDHTDKAIIATRIVEHQDSKALRIVDFYGFDEVLANCGSALQNLMEIHNCEYCDFLQYGISDNILKKCGFENTLNNSIIVPNFFEPFVQKTSLISFAIKSSINAPFKIFRADGDQDRPNLRID